MRFDTGLWDRIFGKRVTINLPGPGGGRKVSVTERWFERMQAEGKITRSLEEHVTVHVLDPVRNYYTETWQVGKDVTHRDFEAFYDRPSQSLYALIVYESGRARTMLLRKDTWENGKREFDAL